MMRKNTPKDEEMMQKTKMYDIPQEVMQKEILSRLPISSILESRCVSEKWCSLIKDPTFSKLQYTFSCQNPKSTSLIYIVNGGKKNLNRLFYSNMETLETTNELTGFRYEPAFSKSRKKFYWGVVGSINGLICFKSSCFKNRTKRFIVCNPVTGDLIKLPRPPVSFSRFGFGWNPKSNEYKVIIVSSAKHNDEMNLEVFIHTLGTNTWRSNGTVPNEIFSNDFACNGFFFNGHLHWLGTNIFQNQDVFHISVFNVQDESFGAVSLPEGIAGRFHHLLFHFAVLEGGLAINLSNNKSSVKVWVRKNESWILQFTIRKPARYGELELLGTLENGNVLLLYSWCIKDAWTCKLSSYDPVTKTHELLEMKGLPSSFSVFSHVGTLARLKDVIAIKECGQGCYRRVLCKFNRFTGRVSQLFSRLCLKT